MIKSSLTHIALSNIIKYYLLSCQEKKVGKYADLEKFLLLNTLYSIPSLPPRAAVKAELP